jgi:hypothetical protein
MLFFDEYGLLTPASGISCTTDELFDTFVQSFPESQTRTYLFQQWEKYNRLLRQEIGVGFVQWVNGSFVTMKPHPKDIDIVSFIPSGLFRKFEKRLDYYWSDNWEREGIDAYLVDVQIVLDSNYELYRQERAGWNQLYTRTKRSTDPANKSKGYLTINVL